MNDMRRILMGIAVETPDAGLTGSEVYVPIRLSWQGGIWSVLAGLEGVQERAIRVDFGDVDNISAAGNPALFTALQTSGFLFGYDPIGNNWDRLRLTFDNADVQSEDAAVGKLGVVSRAQLWDGVNWNRARGNQDLVLLPAAVRNASTNSADQVNFNARGLHVVFDITAVPGVDTVTITIEGKDALSGKYYPILIGAATPAVGTKVLRVYPALTVVANLTENDILPRDWRVTVTHSGAGAFTYSVGASLIL